MRWGRKVTTIRQELLERPDVERFKEEDVWLDTKIVQYRNYRDVLSTPQFPSIHYFQTTTGWVWVSIYAYKKHLYVFIPADPSRPGVREGDAWHGRFLGRVT